MTKKATHIDDIQLDDDASLFTLKDMVRDWWTIGMAILFIGHLCFYAWSIMN